VAADTSSVAVPLIGRLGSPGIFTGVVAPLIVLTRRLEIVLVPMSRCGLNAMLS
jgi:hypothetical protein